ncbi:MAG: peptidoglycan DD-metalloendopeptidase family protein [Coriobacteriia bacterium]|nr:peptidoglycan DD-metalloendopeptidase family protein [Coriobacteriia bacterium]
MPAHRSRLIARALIAFALLTVVVAGAPVAASAITTGSGGWYWPVATEDFQGWDGWWVYRSSNHSWHMAQDMPAPSGHPVYAIGDGVVLESQDGKGYGGVIVVLHRTLEGQLFKAVYGHIHRKSIKKGDVVTAGQIIGTINGDRHVHFGIHPGRAYPSDRNPYRGHTYTKKRTYGWVNPVRFLRENPRSLAYTPPKLPRVAVVTATVTPTFLGVAGGRVYYSCDESESVTVYHRPLGGDEAAVHTSGTPLPSLDATRFSAVSVTETSFAVADRLPRLVVRYSTKAPAYRKPLAVTGTLTSRGGSAFKGARVVLESSTDGTSWATVASTSTGPNGRFWMRYTPGTRSRLRVHFAPRSIYMRTGCAATTVAPSPGLGRPLAPKTIKASRRFEVEGGLRAPHPSGRWLVTLEYQKRVGAVWRPAFKRQAITRAESHGRVYERWGTLARGEWRVRATMPADKEHAAQTTGWARVSAR